MPDLQILARAERDQDIIKLQRAGATHVISLAQQGSRNITDLLMRPNMAQLFGASVLEGEGLGICELHVSDRCSIAGQTLHDIGRKHAGLVFIGLRRAGGTIEVRPPATSVVDAGDVLLVVGAKDELLPAQREIHAAA